MEEGYLEWLLGLPFLGDSKARSLAEHFPSFEHLRVATREELASVPGLTPEDVDGLVDLLRPDRPSSMELFLCSACGSFAGSGATACPVCGAPFGEGTAGEASRPAEVRQSPSEPVPTDVEAAPAGTEARVAEPDRSYVEWLEGLPAIGPEKARRIIARFPTFEHLRSATREELASVEGLVPGDLAALDTLLGEPSPGDEAGRPFLCPECGSFTGSRAAQCSVCGADLAESSVEKALASPPDAPSADGLPLLCLHCGAFMSPKQVRCGMCGHERTVGEITLLPGVDVPSEANLPFCPHCGAYLYAESDECIICGRTPTEPKVSATNGQATGVGRGFLSRWKRIAEDGVASEEERLHEQLEHFDRLVEVDPLLERAWAKRGRVLAQLGRRHEAAESLARAADLNPAKDESYRLEVLDLLTSPADAPFLPHRWRAPAPTAGPAPDVTRLLEALRHYEALLEADAGFAVAWRTKGEILERLGRRVEAGEAFERARAIEGREELAQRESLAGLQSMGPVRSGRTEGSKGRVNGRINGLTNGRVNGFVNGRINGLTTHAAPGLTLGRGTTNGLVNGDGFTNGRRGRYGPGRLPRPPHWSRSAAGVAGIVALMVLVPLLLSLVTPVPASLELIRIDHDFSDWSTVPPNVDALTDQTANPDVNLVTTKITATEDDLFLYARVQGQMFRAPAPDAADSLFVFVDEDSDRTTGYAIGNLGADVLGEVLGWAGAIRSATRHAFDPAASSDDWNGFRSSGSIRADAYGSELELRLATDLGTVAARVLVYAADNRGNRDPSDAFLRARGPALYLEQRTLASDTIASGPVVVSRITLVPVGGTPYVAALNVTQDGSSGDPVSLSLYLDDGSGSFDAADSLLATAPIVSRRSTLAVDRVLTGPLILWLEARWPVMTPASTFGVRASDVWTDGSATLRPPETHLSYLVASPGTLTVDGAFGDWVGRSYGQDLLGDVVNGSASPAYNANVDLLATAWDVGTNVTGFARVDGRILGGEDIPTVRTRFSASAAPDTDLDGVPDVIEFPLGPGLAYDFDNDNVTDNRTNGDVDADGLVDYPAGPDMWLNTTIPSWYPAPYRGLRIARYIGPIAPTIQEGLDVMYAYVDADNASGSGLPALVEGQRYGFDYAFAVLGRNGVIRSAGLYVYAPGSSVPWSFDRNVSAALDAHRIEFSTDVAALALAADHRVVFYASDWRRNVDAARPEASLAQFVVRGQALATSVVVNEISPSSNPEWVELANPTTTAISLSGWNLVIVRGNKVVVVYSFTVESLGAWGSGTEYLRVNLAANSLPNANARLLLRAGTTVVDEVAYGSVAASRSWARLKDPLVGVPMDGNTAADFYLSLVPSPLAANDRHRPTFAFAKTSGASTGAPGDTVTYTIYYNNTDTGLAKTVWINDTLPSGVTFVTSSVAPATVLGSTYGWVFTDVLPNTFGTITVTVVLDAGLTDGASLSNAATLQYTDQLRRPLATVQAWANLTVARPVITIAKTVSPANAMPGDLVTFTLYYNNTGSAAAGTVSIKDTLPTGLTYIDSAPVPTWTDGVTFYWNFTNVGPGSYSIALTAQVDPLFTGTSLVNWAFLNYTTLNGFPLESSEASVVVSVPEMTDVLWVGAVPILILVLARKTRRSSHGTKAGVEMRGRVADGVPRTGGR